MDKVLELKNVTKDYGDFKLDNVNLSVTKGAICGFIGQNGAGKTTTISLILDIIKRDAGDIQVFGEDILENPTAIKERIGVVFDEMGFHDFMTATQISKMMANIYKNWDEEVFFDYLEKFSLPRKKRCGAFSRGMRMKLQIAVAMSHGAELLIMDEPTSGLDPIVRNEILQIFQEFVMEENHTILLSSHITTDLERIADEVVFINKGKIVLAGNKDEILETHGLMKCKKNDLTGIDEKDIISTRPSAFCTEVLVADRQACAKKYPKVTMEQTTLEDIMIFYVNRGSQVSANGESSDTKETSTLED
ncbi:MAG: ABC transporter ATP-binding protein [Lachnospiraceae bacterium]|nr:ABC transporter ATP-binding protein [Lachnospiraceae bacterium]